MNTKGISTTKQMPGFRSSVVIPDDVYAKVLESGVVPPGESRQAVLVYIVGALSSSSEGSLSSMTPIQNDTIAIAEVAVSIADLIHENAKTIRISFRGPGDVNVSYLADSEETINAPTITTGELWLQSGIMTLSRELALTIRFIRNGSVNSVIYITQFS